jgi:Disulphide bond corrector protein DsbC
MKLITFLLLGFSNFVGFSQEKVTWSNVYNAKTKNIEMTASIAEGWHLYSQFISNEIGPIPTSFTFTENEFVSIAGKVSEPKAIQEYDENFEATLDFFKNEVMFTQKAVAKQTTVEEIIITYMVCNETMCLPPIDQKFTVEIKAN